MLSIFGLVLLLLISPCKVRNFIESELGVPQTKVLNKSQSTFSQSNCQTIEVYESIQPFSEPNTQQLDYPILEANSFEFEISLLKHSFNQRPSRSQQVSEIPLYILYQKLQIYS